jgi:hypothetical protein
MAHAESSITIAAALVVLAIVWQCSAHKLSLVGSTTTHNSTAQHRILYETHLLSYIS